MESIRICKTRCWCTVAEQPNLRPENPTVVLLDQFRTLGLRHPQWHATGLVYHLDTCLHFSALYLLYENTSRSISGHLCRRSASYNNPQLQQMEWLLQQSNPICHRQEQMCTTSNAMSPFHSYSPTVQAMLCLILPTPAGASTPTSLLSLHQSTAALQIGEVSTADHITQKQRPAASKCCQTANVFPADWCACCSAGAGPSHQLYLSV